MGSVLDAEKERAKHQAQRDLLIDYIGEHYDMLVGNDNVLDDYVSHEVSADGESITVRIKVRKKSLPGYPNNFALTRQRVIKRSDIVEFHKSRGRELNYRTDMQPTNPVAVHQVSWADQRHDIMHNSGHRYSETYLKEIEKHVSIVAIEPPADMVPRARVDTLKCSCLNRSLGPIMCEHLRFVYATGWERESLLDSKGDHCVMLPIGMDLVSIPVLVHHADDDDPDGKPTGMTVVSDYKRLNASTFGPLRILAEEVTAYPDESASVTLGPGEGIIKVIRYVEDMIKATEIYSVLSNLAADDANVRGKANLVCGRKHDRPMDRALLAQFQAGIRLANVNRENWMVATALTYKISGLCLPCYNATSATNNVPSV